MIEVNGPTQEIVGLIPAGGQATRIAPLPCSKELYPIGFRSVEEGLSWRPKVVSHYLLEKMRFAGISKIYFVLRPGKWDIPAYFGDGSMLGINLAYLALGVPFGVPFTLDQAYAFVRHATVAFGFPDILFDAEDGFVKLLARRMTTDADIALGLTPSSHSLSMEDRVELDEDGSVRDLVLRPVESELRYSWAIAVWKPSFTQFLHDYVADKKTTAQQNSELSAGHAILAGIKAGLRVQTIIISEKPYLDIGTPDGLHRATRLTMSTSGYDATIRGD
jgi:glucose-1-phosphate thymidylyltransferase